MLSPKPTPRQSSYLQQIGVEVPPTKTAAASIIEFVLEGNRLFPGTNKFQRIALFKSMQGKWIGKRVFVKVMVTDPPREEFGTVLYLRPYRKDELVPVADKKLYVGFQARVQWDDRKPSSCVLSSIELKEG